MAVKDAVMAKGRAIRDFRVRFVSALFIILFIGVFRSLIWKSKELSHVLIGLGLVVYKYISEKYNISFYIILVCTD